MQNARPEGTRFAPFAGSRPGLVLVSMLVVGLGGCISGSIGGEPAEGPAASGKGGTSSTSSPTTTGGSASNGSLPGATGAASNTAANGAPAGLPGTGAAPAQPLEDGVGGSLIRRLSREEIGNAVESLVGVRPAAVAQIPSDKQDFSYDRVAESQTVTLAHLEAFAALADELGTALTPAKLAPVVPACGQPMGTDGPEMATQRRACIESLIDTIGRRAFRRAMVADKRAALLALYDSAGSYNEGLRLVLQGIFAAPEFLYVVESGTPVAGKPGVFALGDHEIATRLSLFVCETIPDATLLAAADAGQLKEPAQIAAQAKRLFALPCARRAVSRFFRQWLAVEKVAGLARDPAQFPEWNDALKQALLREQEAFVQHITFDVQGSLQDMFNASYSFLDKSTAPLYGLTSSATAPTKTELPANRRGLLTQPAVMAVTSHLKETSPVLRGVYVLERLLCRHLPPPPKDIDLKAPAPDANNTTRNRWEKHSADPSCSGCHTIIDPVGFAMEDFDSIGRHRSSENGQPVNAGGAIPTLNVAAGQVQGGAGLSAVLAGSDELAGCFAQQWFRFGLGRLDSAGDSKALADMTTQLRQGKPLAAMMTSLVESYPFRHRAVGVSR